MYVYENVHVHTYIMNNILCHCTLYCASGLVFDESQPRDVTLQPEKQKPKVTLAQDPKQAKVHCPLCTMWFSLHTQ